MTSSSDWLHYQAEIQPNKEALVTPKSRWTFQRLDADVARLAGILRGLGVHPGDRVAYLLPSGAPHVILAHALTRLHAILVPLNTRLTPTEREPIFHNSDPALLIYDATLSASAWSRQSIAIEIQDLMSRPSSDPVTDTHLDFDERHALVYTSGTTGIPKGVEITVGNQWWSAVGFALNAGINPSDRWLHVMPLFHVGGLSILFRGVIHGSTVVLEPRFDAKTVYGQLQEQEITLISVVPTMIRRLLALGHNAPPHLRLALLGGAPASPELIQEARQQGYPVVPTYGLTETCSQVVTMRNDEVLQRLGSSGHPNLPTEIRIQHQGRNLPVGTLGEIAVKGPTVSKGYWRNPSVTAQTFRDGWLMTGDMGMLDADGYLTVIDRVKDRIIRGGENIYPTEVESQLKAHPAIKDAAVFGLSDPEWGQIVAAACVLTEDLKMTELRNFLSNRLASYKMPTTYFRVEDIPRTASGKILRTHLIESASTLREWNAP